MTRLPTPRCSRTPLLPQPSAVMSIWRVRRYQRRPSCPRADAVAEAGRCHHGQEAGARHQGGSHSRLGDPRLGAEERRRPVPVLPHFESALMNCPVMPSAQQHEVAEGGCAAVDPVLHVMRVAAAGRAAWEPATPIASLQRLANRRRHGACPAPHIANDPGPRAPSGSTP